MRAVLRAICPDDRHQRSLSACRRVTELDEWQNARSVFLYLALPRELDTTPLVEEAWRRGKRVAVPRVDADRSGAMDAVPIESWSDCLPGYRGILEPVDGDPIEMHAIDLAVVPGLAFDLAGRRLGQGGGFYDRFLARHDLRAAACGMAFEEQVVERVPVDPHDRTVDLLVTDASVRRVNRSG